jgi:hypothetical protein
MSDVNILFIEHDQMKRGHKLRCAFFFKFCMLYLCKKLRQQLTVQPTDYSAVLTCARASLRYLFLPTLYVICHKRLH